MAHRRRGVGVNRTSHARVATQKKADEMKAVSLQNAIDTLEELEMKLSQFARIHSDDIQNDPIFRYSFFQMCSPLGIDPLCSSKKKNNNKSLFGNIVNSDYFYELSVKVAEVCLANRTKNGGIMSINDVQKALIQRKTKLGTTSANIVATNNKKGSTNQQADINISDIQIAIEKLSILGGGFRTIEVGKILMIVSVPTELNNDHITILNIAAVEQVDTGLTIRTIQQHCPNWSHQRIEQAIQLLLQEGMIWLDTYKNIDYYWFTSIWQKEK